MLKTLRIPLAMGAATLLLAGGAIRAQETETVDDPAIERSQTDSFAQPEDRDESGRDSARFEDQESYEEDYDRSQEQRRFSRSQRPDESRQQRERSEQEWQREQERRGGLGVALSMREEEAAVVEEVMRGSPAEEAGLEQGDQIIAVDGRRVSSAQQLADAISQREPGSTVELTVVRDGERRRLEANLESRREALSSAEMRRRRDEQWQGSYGRRFNSSREESMDRQRREELSRRIDSLERHLRGLSQELRQLRAELDRSDQRMSRQRERFQDQSSRGQRSDRQQREYSEDRGDQRLQYDENY